MRSLLVSAVPCWVVVSLALLAGPAQAHISLKYPTPRTDQLKQGPCGAGANDPRGPTVATFKPGENITVKWNEFVDHPGHFRIALDPDGQDDFFEPKSFDDVSGGPGVIVDGIFDQNGGDYAVEITLPDFECDNCVLQVIQVMTDKKPYGDGNDLYYQCADIALVGEVGTTGEPGSTGPGTTTDEDTTAASDVSAGETGATTTTTGTTGTPGSEGGETAGGTAGEVTTGEAPTSNATAAEDGDTQVTGGGASTVDASTGGGEGTSTGGATTDGASEDSGCGCRGDPSGGAGWLALGLLPLVTRRRRA